MNSALAEHQYHLSTASQDEKQRRTEQIQLSPDDKSGVEVDVLRNVNCHA